jgi:hypothetical protein
VPTTRGAVATGICLFVIPLMADLFLIPATAAGKFQVAMSSTLFHGYIYFAPRYFAYFFIYFLFLKILFYLFKYTEH